MENDRQYLRARFGNFTVIRELPLYVSPKGSRKRIMKCRCDCGFVTDYLLSHLKAGRTPAHACKLLEYSRTYNQHGLTRHPLYRVWKDMIRRCHRSIHPRYADYGGRGIRVCKPWRGVAGVVKFVQWNDSLPKARRWELGLTLDRIDNDLGYEPSNCRWATNIEQSKNRRSPKPSKIRRRTKRAFSRKVTYKGERVVAKSLFDRFERKGRLGRGVTYDIFVSRVRGGLPVKTALTRPRYARKCL